MKFCRVERKRDSLLKPKTHRNPSTSCQSFPASPVEEIRVIDGIDWGRGRFSLYKLNNASLSSTSAGRSFGYTAGERAVLRAAPCESLLARGGRGRDPQCLRGKAAPQPPTNKANVIDLSASEHLSCLWDDIFLRLDS